MTYVDRIVQAYGRLLGNTEIACSNLLITTDLAEVRRIAEHLQRVAKECDDSTKLEPQP